MGNRTGSIQNGIETRHNFNARNQLIKTTEGADITDYTYDRRGNLTQVTLNGQLQMAYTFDATNMMTAAYNPAKGEAAYTYNGFRNRVAKLENYHTEQIAALDPCREIKYVLDMTRPYDNLLSTQSADSQSFVWGNSLLSANGKGAHDNFHYLQDHLGSPIRLANGDNLSQPISYDEFGVPEVTAGVEAVAEQIFETMSVLNEMPMRLHCGFFGSGRFSFERRDSGKFL